MVWMGTVPDFMRTGGFRRVGYEPDRGGFLDFRPGIVFWEPASGSPGLIRFLRPKPTTFDFDIKEPAPFSQVVLNWTLGVDGYDYTVQARVGGADAWINEPGAWPIASTVWTPNTAAAASKDYRILATPR